MPETLTPAEEQAYRELAEAAARLREAQAAAGRVRRRRPSQQTKTRPTREGETAERAT